jgi:hypothetical protein
MSVRGPQFEKRCFRLSNVISPLQQGGWGALNLNSTDFPDRGHHGDPPLSGKNPYDRPGNRTRDPMISCQKRWPLYHEAGHNDICGRNWLGRQPSFVCLFLCLRCLCRLASATADRTIELIKHFSWSKLPVRSTQHTNIHNTRLTFLQYNKTSPLVRKVLWLIHLEVTANWFRTF